MTGELNSLRKVVQKLNEGKFDYFLTGSMAMSFYSVARMTRDADILIKLLIKDVDEFYKILSSEYYIEKNMIEDSVRSGMMFNIFDKKDFFKFDFILKRNDEFEDSAFQRRNKIKMNGLEVYVISKEDLIIAKLNWAKDSFSEQQIKDIKQLMEKNYDKDYVMSWVSKLNLKGIYNKVL